MTYCRWEKAGFVHFFASATGAETGRPACAGLTRRAVRVCRSATKSGSPSAQPLSAERVSVIRQMHKLLYRDGLSLEQAVAAIDFLRGSVAEADAAPPVAKRPARFCSACGTPVLAGARFCQSCGASLGP